MKLNYTDSYTYSFPLEVRRGTFYVWAEEAIEMMQWTVLNQDENYIEAVSPKDSKGLNDSLLIKIDNELITLESFSTDAAGMDKQKDNTLLFLAMLSEASVGKISTIPEDAISLDEALQGEELTYVPDRKKNRIDMLRLLIPRGDFIVAPAIIMVNIVVFLIMAMAGTNVSNPGTDSLIQWGANLKTYTLDGQWWRLITSCFLHVGVMHLVFNMFALLFIGILLEPALGKLRFLLAYFLTGIGASMTSLWWNSFSVSAGASGAIFGLYGVFLALLLMKVAYPRDLRGALLLSALMFIGYNLFLGHTGTTDNAAHVGGLATGLLFGFSCYPGFIRRVPQLVRKYYLVGAIGGLLIIFGIVYRSIPDGIVRYEKTMTEFAKNEEAALSVITTLDQAAPDKQVSMLKNNGIRMWEKNILLLKRLDDMPPELEPRVQLLLRYCELRKNMYQLLVKAIETKDFSPYEQELLARNNEIQNVLYKLHEM